MKDNVIPMKAPAILLSLALAALGAAAFSCLEACGRSKLPAPAYVQQKTSALYEIPYDPPPARTERVPPQPKSGTVWIDGEWTWDGVRWSWKQGRWVTPPEGARFAPWATVRRADGVLFFAPGVWEDAKGQVLPDPVPVLGARVGSSPVVGADGEQFPIGGTIFVADGGAASGAFGGAAKDAGK